MCGRLSVPPVVRACTRLGVLALFTTMARVASRARLATFRPRTRFGTVRPALQEAVKSGVNG